MADLIISAKYIDDGASKGLASLTKSTLLLDKANQDAAGALSTFGVNLGALSNPITAIASGLKSSIDFTTKWGDTIDEITRITGTSARESSKLAIVLGDVGISTDTLTSAAKTLRSQGLTPSLDTLKELAKQYQAIQDPVARNDFLFKKLGRSGVELSEFLSRDVSEIDALGAAAEKSGKIIDEAGIQKAEQYSQKLAQMNDKLDGAKLAVGSLAVDMVGKAIPAGEQYIGIWQALALKAQLATGIIDQNTASVKAAEIAGLSHVDALKQVYAAELATMDASDRLTIKTADVTTATQSSIDAWHTYLGVPIVEAIDAATRAQINQTATLNLANGVYGDALIALQNHNLTLRDEIALTDALNLASGKVTQAQLDNRDAVAFLTQQKALGRLTNDEYLKAMNDLASGARDAHQTITDVGSAIAALPKSTDIYITTHYVSVGDGAPPASAGEVGLGGEAPVTQPAPTGSEAPIGGRQQHGTDGWLTVPPGYNENYTIGMSSGEQYNVIPPGQSNVTTMGNVTIQVMGAGDPRAVAEEVARILGAQRDARQRTGG